MNGKCVFCSSQKNRDDYMTDDIHANSYHIKSCLDCNSYFLHPLPSPELLEEAYDESYYGEGDDKFGEGWIEKIIDYFRRKRAKLISKKINSKGKVLDIGCGNGRFLQFIKEKGDFDIYGLEMPGGSAERAKRVNGLQLKLGALEKNDYAKNQFDAVTMFHVFEHLIEPNKYLNIIDDILKPGGVLAVSFPNIASNQSRIFKGKWFHMDAPRHLFFFSSKDFKNIMKKRGYVLENEKHFSLEYNTFGFQQSLLNKVLKKREVLYETLKGNKVYGKEYGGTNIFMQQLFFKISAPIFICSDLVASVFSRGATVEFVFRKVE